MNLWLWIRLDRQRLWLIDNGIIVRAYPVSTARNGAGEIYGSGCTPRGWHYIRAKIGAGLPPQAVLVGRRFTGEIYSKGLAARQSRQDWILSRILWLCGLEPGVNRLGKLDTFRRYIYIHGSPDHLIDGHSRSCGCIRMRNQDVIELFDRVPAGTRVYLSTHDHSSTSPPTPK